MPFFVQPTFCITQFYNQNDKAWLNKLLLLSCEHLDVGRARERGGGVQYVDCPSWLGFYNSKGFGVCTGRITENVCIHVRFVQLLYMGQVKKDTFQGSYPLQSWVCCLSELVMQM